MNKKTLIRYLIKKAQNQKKVALIWGNEHDFSRSHFNHGFASALEDIAYHLAHDADFDALLAYEDSRTPTLEEMLADAVKKNK